MAFVIDGPHLGQEGAGADVRDLHVLQVTLQDERDLDGPLRGRERRRHRAAYRDTVRRGKRREAGATVPAI
jgi:hypothetical protein